MSEAARLTVLVAATAWAVAPACSFRRAPEALPAYGEEPAIAAFALEFTFGVPPSRSPTSLFQDYRPLLRLVSEGGPFSLRFQTATNGSRYRQRLQVRGLDFALVGPADAIDAEDWGYRIVAKTAEADNVQGVLIADSGIQKLSQLKGSRICFGSPDELAGTMMVKLYLRQHGFHVDRDATPVYVGSGESCAINVAVGMAAAGGVAMDAWAALRSTHPEILESVKQVFRTERLPGVAVVARRNLPAGLVRELSRRLIQLEDRPGATEALRAAGFSGFRPISEGSYDPVWQFLMDYRRIFGTTGATGGAGSAPSPPRPGTDPEPRGSASGSSGADVPVRAGRPHPAEASPGTVPGRRPCPGGPLQSPADAGPPPRRVGRK